MWDETKNDLQKTTKKRTYFDPKDRHFLCPGVNLATVAAVILTEPEVFAGDKFSEAKAVSKWQEFGVTDSFELQLDKGGSSFNDFL